MRVGAICSEADMRAAASVPVGVDTNLSEIREAAAFLARPLQQEPGLPAGAERPATEAEGGTKTRVRCATTAGPIVIDVFEGWVKDLRAKGITVPIRPGIMPLNAYGGFQRMTGFCKTRIPPEMEKKLEELKGDDKKAEFTEWGVDYMVDLCQKLVKSKLVPGLHFYCLNQSERTYQILRKLKYLKEPMEEPIAQMAATAIADPTPKSVDVM